MHRSSLSRTLNPVLFKVTVLMASGRVASVSGKNDGFNLQTLQILNLKKKSYQRLHVQYTLTIKLLSGLRHLNRQGWVGKGE